MSEQTSTGMFRIDGEDVQLSSLTFREQDNLASLVRKLTEDDTIEPVYAPLRAFLPALVAVVRSRTDDRTLEQLLDEARDLRFDEVMPPEEPERPTRRSSSRSKRSSAASADATGTPAS